MPETGILETRRNFYALLYRMYLEQPSREFVDDLMNERFYLPDLISEEELSEGFKLVREFVEKSKDKAIDELHKDLVGEYTRLFIGPHRLPVQPYESWWVDGKRMGESLLKVKQVYRKAGIAKVKEYAERRSK
ncbi:Tat proofreading chaperone DmsD [ANME-1 cluster archaeon GoMg3.2]|nr:Tat proofreading chaperone DmsD [ANME-1 cluster archaeon GoMg3.2]